MKEICDRRIEYLRPGLTCADVYEKALSVAREIGMEPHYLRLGGNPEILPFVGHGIGLEVNELPLLSRGNRDVIQEGVVPCLFLNDHHIGSLPMQLKVVWSPLLQADFEGPPLISCAASWRTYHLKSSKMLHATSQKRNSG
jgi:hypothetical protein